MAFTVSRKRNQQFTISTGDGNPVSASTVDEACVALRHYYGTEPGHGGKNISCPFCRWMNRPRRGE